jgi:hypothetical protein
MRVLELVQIQKYARESDASGRKCGSQLDRFAIEVSRGLSCCVVARFFACGLRFLEAKLCLVGCIYEFDGERAAAREERDSSLFETTRPNTNCVTASRYFRE